MARIVLAQMSHETNTFSPVVTDLARFSRGAAAPPSGADAARIFRGTATGLGGYLAVCDERGYDVQLPIAAGAAPSGPVEDEAFEYIAERIVDAVASGCDGVMLDLHGAMVTRSHDDGEGELLRRIRSVNATVPIAVCLDMHANLFDAMVQNCSVLTGYHTYPHVDMDAAARRAGRLLADMLDGTLEPVMAWGNAPMLPHVMRQGTDDLPNRALQARAAELERQGVSAVSLFTGFPHADVREAGLSVCVVTNADLRRAEAIRDELLDSAWRDRQSFVYVPEPLEDSVARARELGLVRRREGPVILLDHYDNTASGGTMDTTEVLAEILRQDLDDVAVFGIYDPGAVRAMAEAGVGAEVTRRAGRQARHAGAGAPEPAAHRDRPGEALVRRRVPRHRRDVARPDDADGDHRGAFHREGGHRRGIAARGTVRSRLLSRRRHRTGVAALPDAEEPHPLPRRLS